MFTIANAVTHNEDGSLYKIEVDNRTGAFRDETGVSFVFHGANVVVKSPPYLPDYKGRFDPQMSLNKKDMDDLADWGFNVVRLGIIWEAVETSPNVYNDTYLDEVETIIKRLAKRGIYTILDSHQDLFSRVLCGVGVPVFYTPTWDELDHECSWTSPVGSIFKLFHQCDSFSSYGVQNGPDGLPLLEECAKVNDAAMHTSPEIASAYEHLWENKNGL